jgi:NADH-quinone oxidoreductase subunit J
MMLQAEFIAITLIVVYVGAVMVLFLFVVMMLDIRIDSARRLFWKNFPLAALLGGVVAVQMVAVLMLGFPVTESMLSIPQSDVPNTKGIGLLMYSSYIFPIQVAALLLLVAMVAAIALTMRKRKDTRTARVSDQVRVSAHERMVVVDTPFEALPSVAPPQADSKEGGSSEPAGTTDKKGA